MVGVDAWEVAVRAREKSLRVGVRVRVAGGECPLQDGWTTSGRRVTINGSIAHRPEEVGRAGVITVANAGPRRFGWSEGMTIHDEAENGHRFIVLFDEPMPDKAQGGHFCAAELIVLDH